MISGTTGRLRTGEVTRMRRRLSGSLSLATSLGTLDVRARPAVALSEKCDIDPAAESATFSFSVFANIGEGCVQARAHG